MVQEQYSVMGHCVCTAVTGLWFMICVLWLFLLAFTAALTGLQFSGSSEKVICVTRLNLLQDFLKASRGLCGEKKNVYCNTNMQLYKYDILKFNTAKPMDSYEPVDI